VCIHDSVFNENDECKILGLGLEPTSVLSFEKATTIDVAGL